MENLNGRSDPVSGGELERGGCATRASAKTTLHLRADADHWHPPPSRRHRKEK